MNKVIAIFVGLGVMVALAVAPITVEAKTIQSYKHYVKGKGNVKKGGKPVHHKIKR